MRAALYARVSLDRQDYEQQLAGFSSYCLEMGYTPAGEYLEKITGTRADRPEYQRLLADATAGKFERVVCRAPDRFGRDAEEAMFQYLDLKRRGVVVEYTHAETPTIVDAASEFDRAEKFIRTLSMTVRSNLLHRAESGIDISPPAFGYDRIRSVPGPPRIPGQTVINEAEAIWVRRIFAWFLTDNLGLESIAAKLREDGVPTKRKGKWNASTVHGILTNPRYSGTWQYRTLDRRGEEVVVEQPCPAIISPEEQQAALERLAVKASIHAPRAQRSAYLLSGILYCGKCDGRMNGRKPTSRGWTRRYYICRRAKESRRSECEGNTVIADDLEDAVVRELSSRFPEVSAIREQIASDTTALQRELGRITRDKATVARRIQGNNDRLDDGVITREVWADEHRRHAADLERFDREYETVSTEIQSLRARSSRAEETAERISTLAQDIQEQTPQQVKAHLQNMIERITVQPDGSVNVDLRR